MKNNSKVLEYRRLFYNVRLLPRGDCMVYVEYQNYFVGWGTLALLNSAIAQLQSRSALLWFFLSLLFGPIATLFLLVTYKKP